MKIFKTNKFIDIWHIVELVALVVLLWLFYYSVGQDNQIVLVTIMAFLVIPDTIVLYFMLRFASKSDGVTIVKIVIMSIKFLVLSLFIFIALSGVFRGHSIL